MEVWAARVPLKARPDRQRLLSQENSSQTALRFSARSQLERLVAALAAQLAKAAAQLAAPPPQPPFHPEVASRLEARTKDYRIPIVIGEATAQKAKERFATMEIDRIQVKGKTQPETVFTVLGRAELGRDPNFLELHELTTKMLRYYREQNWTQALDTIEPCRKAAEGFGVGALYHMYAERIEAFRHNPPPADWNGVYEAESK